MFVLGKSFQPTLMVVGKIRSLPSSGAPDLGFTRVGSDALAYNKKSYITDKKGL